MWASEFQSPALPKVEVDRHRSLSNACRKSATGGFHRRLPSETLSKRCEEPSQRCRRGGTAVALAGGPRRCQAARRAEPARHFPARWHDAQAEVTEMKPTPTLDKTRPILVLVAAALTGLAGCGDLTDEFGVAEGAALGDRIPGTSTTDSNFASFKANFVAVEELDEGLGPIFSGRAGGPGHSPGAPGGAGRQVEGRYGRFVTGAFVPLSNRGGSLRQLFTVVPFTGANRQSCSPPLEVEPPEATVHNVGRV